MPPDLQSAAQPSRRVRALLALAVFCLAALPFVRALGQPFVAWDDDVNFLFNEHFRGFGADELRWMWSTFYVGHYMPLTWMSCALDYSLAGLSPGQFHATNVVLHATTALFLYFASVELLKLSFVPASPAVLRLCAALGALFFAMHPLRAESVAWATERRDVLSGAFVAVSVWSWLCSKRKDSPRGAWLAVSIASFAASLLSKVSGFTLPLVLLAVDVWPLRRVERSGWRAVLLEKLPYFALALGGALLGYFGQRESTEALASLEQRSLLERVAISAYALRFYLRKTLLPLDLSAFYELPEHVDPLQRRYLASIVFVALATAVLFARRKRWNVVRGTWTTWLSFVILIAPVIGLVQAGRQIAADRYTYLPSFALAAGFAAMCARRGVQRFLYVPAALIAVLGVLAWRQTGTWRDSETLFRRVVEVEPWSYLGHHKLGILAHQRGAFDEALEQYAQALEARPGHGHADAYYDRALTWLARKEPERAGPDLEAALADQPAHLNALRVITDLEVAYERPEEAVAWYERALAREPDEPELHFAFGALLAKLGRSERALAEWKRTLELDPDHPGALARLGPSH